MIFSYYIVVAFATYFYTLKIGDIRGLYSDAAGLCWKNRYRAIAESLANIILNIILVQIYGVLGIITMLACNSVQGRLIIVLIFRLLLCIFIPNTLYILFYRKTHDFIVATTWLINQLKYKKCQKFCK